LGTFRGVRGPVRVTTGKHGSIAADDVVRTSVSNGRTSHWRPLRRLTASSGGLRLSLTLDGVRDMKLPPHVVARDTLRATELPAWRALAATAWRLLVSRHRAVAEEIASTLFVLTPLATSLPGHDSSLTFSDAFGCVAMSLPRSARHLALTLVHEVQHAKLSVLLDVVELVDSASPQRLRVAWREDLRPPVAVLHGAYAHLAVAAFWRRHDDLEARTEFIRWSSATRAALDALSNAGVLTGSGRLFVAGMREQLDSLTVLGDQCHTMDKKLSH
ncbi:MAG TPA: HEXXH motif-containing putative peptide modification protein, partial [Lentzea sp.]